MDAHLDSPFKSITLDDIWIWWGKTNDKWGMGGGRGRWEACLVLQCLDNHGLLIICRLFEFHWFTTDRLRKYPLDHIGQHYGVLHQSMSYWQWLNPHAEQGKMTNKQTSSPITSSLTIIQFGFPIAHRFILASSPPVTITRPDFWPNAKHVTADPCATNSPAINKEEQNQLV